MEQNLEYLREKINSIDAGLVKLFEKRMKAVNHIAQYKKSHNLKVLDAGREKVVIQKAVECLEDKGLEVYLKYFMEDLMTICRQYQLEQMKEQFTDVDETGIVPPQDSVIGHYGSPGSYTEEAVLEHFGENYSRKAYMSFEEVITALLSREIDIGVLPIENSSTGTITSVVDLIRDNSIYITGEHISRVCHHLLAVPGSTLSDIKTVYSHNQGLEQSSRFLKQYPWTQIVYMSTAASAKLVRDLGDKSKAAIASERSAKMYGLDILVPNIQYNRDNFTRFITVAREPVKSTACNKISIVMGIAHKPGALYSILRLFNERNLNLLKIESRPIIGKPWEYLFFFDFEGNLGEERVRGLLECLKDASDDLRVLGNYKAGFTPKDT